MGDSEENLDRRRWGPPAPPTALPPPEGASAKPGATKEDGGGAIFPVCGSPVRLLASSDGCPGRWWTLRQRPRAPTPRRLYEAGSLSCVGLGGDLDKDCTNRGFVDLTGSLSGNMKVDLVATPGRQPRYRVVLVAIWMKTAWAEGSSTMTGSLSGCEGRSGCYAGRLPRSGWCALWRLSTWIVWTTGHFVYVILLYRLYGFWTRFPL